MSNLSEFDQALDEWDRVFIRRSMQAFISWMKQSGLSRSQVGTLMRLHHNGSCPVSSIGNDMDISTAAASQLVDRLVQMGLIDRTEDLNDRRVKLIDLNQAGRDLLRQGFEYRREWLKGLGDKFSEEEQLALAKSLVVLVEAARSIDENS